MRIEMHDPQGQLLKEMEYPGITQKSVALTYAFIIRQLGDAADWPRINAAIRSKWKGRTALERVKKMAWAHCFPKV
jgi:hypothetical protein